MKIMEAGEKLIRRRNHVTMAYGSRRRKYGMVVIYLWI